MSKTTGKDPNQYFTKPKEYPKMDTRKAPYITYMLAAICGAVFLTHLSFKYFGDRPDLLVSWMAKDNDAITGGEWWRFLTAHFLHTNILHLAANLLLLISLGRLLEPEIGGVKFLSLCFVGGAAGEVASYFFTLQNAYGFSAIGMGLFGAFSMALIRSPDRKKHLVWIVLLGMAVFIDNGPILGRFVDTWAHLSALLAGTVYEMIFVRPDLL